MKVDNIMAALIQIYANAIMLAQNNKQTVGKKNDFYITLEQLEALMKQFK